MSDPATELRWLRDARLAPLSLSAMPAWLWAADASHVLWANPTGAAIFGAANPATLAARKFDAGQPAAAQVAHLAATLTPGAAPRLERLRGVGAGIGRRLRDRAQTGRTSDRRTVGADAGAAGSR